MKSYDELRKDFDDAVEKLQRECLHEDVSDWTEYYWAPAHSTGELVKTCKICNKIVRILRPNFKFVEKEEGHLVQEDLGWQEIDIDGNIVEMTEQSKKELEEIQKKNEDMNAVSYSWSASGGGENDGYSSNDSKK